MNKHYNTVHFFVYYCDARLLVMDAVVKWLGATHDIFVWNDCGFQELVETNEIRNGWLLGDSGYPCTPNLLTPLLAPSTPAERAYNRSQKKTRCAVERTIDVWKMRFLCLHKYGGHMMFDPERFVLVILATLCLHNICRRVYTTYAVVTTFPC